MTVPLKNFLAALAVATLLCGCAVSNLETQHRNDLPRSSNGAISGACLHWPYIIALDWGVADVAHEMVPGAHRVLLGRPDSGWERAMGVYDLTTLAEAGFLTVRELSVRTSDRNLQHAREYKLTRLGYEAMAFWGEGCFEYQFMGGAKAHPSSASKKLHSVVANENEPCGVTTCLNMVRVALKDERFRYDLTPSFCLRIEDADFGGNPHEKTGPMMFIFYEQSNRKKGLDYRHALEIATRLNDAKLACVEAFDDMPYPGARRGIGKRFVLSAALTEATRSNRGCLPLGRLQIENIRTLESGGPDILGFRGWGKVVEQRPWANALAEQFPHVRSMLEIGIGVYGHFEPFGRRDAIHVTLKAPRIEIDDRPRLLEVKD